MTDSIYYLVMHKWVNGNSYNSNSGNRLSMLNSWGRSCCLGQFALQKGVDKKTLSNLNSPFSIYCELGENYDDNFLTKNAQGITFNSRLAVDLTSIEDLSDLSMTDSERAEKIKERMEKDGLKLIILHSNY